jgi:hypothetical protein
MYSNENPSGIAQAHSGPARTALGCERRPRRWRPLTKTLAKVGTSVVAVMAVVGVSGLALASSANPAAAATKPAWFMTAGNIQQLSLLQPATTSYFFNTPAAYGAGASLVKTPIQAGYATTPVLAYTSYAQFSWDIRNGNIQFPYEWVMYDPENWSQTPLNEQQDPIKYMNLFGQLAHANGLKVVQAPARDLAYVTGSVIPRLSGESASHWFVRVNIAGSVAPATNIFLLQDESNTTDLTQYDWLYNNVASQARAANPYIKAYSEVSTVNGTAAQMVAAARSISPDGFYVAAPTLSTAADFFQTMKADGY